MSGILMKNIFKTLTLAVLIFTLSACSGSREEAASKYLNNGIELYDAEKLSKASVQLRNALQIDPKLAKAYFYLALISEKEQNWKSLFKNLTKVEQLDKTHVGAKVKLGYLLLLAKQFDSAIEKADQVLLLDTNNSDSYLIKASAFLGKELYDVAMSYVVKASEAGANSLEVLSIESSLLHKQGRSNEALAKLSSAIETEEENLHLLLLRAEIHEDLDDVDAVEADYRLVIQRYPDERAFYLKLVSLLRDNGRISEAQADLESYLRRYPQDTQVRMALVQLVSTNDMQRASDLLDSYIAKDPNNADLRFYRISKLMSTGAEIEALDELQLISAPDFEDQQIFKAISMQAEIKLTAGEREEGLALANKVLELDSHFEDALLARARYYLIGEDLDAAVTDLRVILRNNPESERALVMLANAYVNSGSQQLADDTFRKVLDINPGNIRAAVPVIKSLLEKQQSDRSERVIENALAYSPDNDVLLSILAQIKLSNKDIEGGQQVISKIKAAGRNPAFGDYLSGRALQSQGKYRQAIASYKSALVLNPNLTRALESLSQCYDRLDRRGDLVAYLKTFIQNNPTNLSAFSVMASIQRHMKDYPAAIMTLEQGLQREPGWVSGYSALASNHISMGHPNLAIETYQQGLQAAPDSNLLKMLLASVYERGEKFSEAKALYEGVLVTNPDHYAVINNLASLLTDQFESAENIKRAVALTERFADSDQPFFVDTYAWALVKSGLPQVAEPLFAKVTTIAPNIAIFHYHRGVGLKKLGKMEEAKKALQLAQQTSSSNESLRLSIQAELVGL